MLALFAIAVAFGAVCLFSPGAFAAVSMTNVTTETDLVKTWLTAAGIIAIAAGILVGLYSVYQRSPFGGVAAIVLTVVAGTLFTAALA